MEIQRNMFQIKEQEKSHTKQLKEMKATMIPNVEFKTIRALKELRGRMDYINENLKR